MPTESSRHCLRCDTTKPTSEFNNSKHRPDGLTFYCKSCNRQKWTAYKSADPDGYRARQARRSYKYLLRTKFNLTVEQYDAMLAGQGGVCAICRQPERSRSKNGALKVLAVDHDHLTGKVRGLLCDACNKGIGVFQDDSARLAAAIEYLARYADWSSQSSGRPTGTS